MNKILKKRSGFTYVELMVIIGIFAIVGVAAYLFLHQARVKARDARRVSDIQNIQQALNQYKMDYGLYPNELDPGEPLIGLDGKTFLAKVPQNPTPNDGDCFVNEYDYVNVDNGRSYYVDWCLGTRLRKNIGPDDCRAKPTHICVDPFKAVIAWSETTMADELPENKWHSIVSFGDTIIIVTDNYFNISHDLGETWESTRIRYINDIAMSKDGQTIILAKKTGSRENMQLSLDGGQNWSDVTSLPSEAGGGVGMDSSGQLILSALNSPGSVYESINQGVSWVNEGVNYAWKDAAVSPGGAYQLIVGDGRAYLSVDGGWQDITGRLDAGDDDWRKAKICGSSGVMLIMPQQGYLMISEDNGATWEKDEVLGYQGVMKDVSCSDDGRIIVTSITKQAEGALVMVTTDRGRSWTGQEELNTGSHDWIVVEVDPEGNYILVGDDKDSTYIAELK